MVKAYVVTLLNIPQSVEVATRCIESGKTFNIDVEIFPAVWKDFAEEELKREGLKVKSYDTRYSNPGAVIGNFVSQYRIWKKILELGKPGIVLEHDAVFVAPIPDLTGQGEIISLGKPSYGSFKSQKIPGVYPLYSKSGYVPGAHGYYVTPLGAQRLIEKAKIVGAGPCDLFLGTFIPDEGNTPLEVREIWPWPVEAWDSFTTIQNETGCIAKHNWQKDRKNFKIL